MKTLSEASYVQPSLDMVMSSYLTRTGYGYNNQYKNKIQTRQDNVNGTTVSWMIENCDGKWGWTFNGTGAVINFEKETDAVFFSLVHGAS